MSYTFDSVALKTFVDFGGLDKVTYVRQAMGVLGVEQAGYAAALYSDSAERYQAHITSGCSGCSTREKILAVATVRMTGRCSVIEVPSMIGISYRIRDRLWASPSIRITRQTMRTRTGKISTLIKVGLRRSLFGSWYLKYMRYEQVY